MNKLKTILYLASIVIILCAFNFAHNLTSGWKRQDFPNIGNRNVGDMFFIDSLTGWAITAHNISDTSYILKTTNSGFNWFIINIQAGGYTGNEKIFFRNKNIGYISGVGLFQKTTNGGQNWLSVNLPGEVSLVDDFSILNEDTIWIADPSGFSGGIFKTINGGQNWTRQYNFSSNPDKVYFFNKNLGFFSKQGQPGRLFRTSNGGVTWTDLNPELGFVDIFFKDSLTGWKARSSIQKTTNGGLNWINQNLPYAQGFILTGVLSFSYVNDTIWAVGANRIISPGNISGILYFTSNGGTNWGYQIPDTNIVRHNYHFVQFLNPKTGWAYSYMYGGIYTTTGGNDTVVFTGIENITSEIPIDYNLEQNYPNPFNPTTIIKFNILKSGFVNVNVYDISGRLISILVNENLKAGEYKTDFNATGLSSGIYFYTLSVNNYKETKKMLLLK